MREVAETAELLAELKVPARQEFIGVAKRVATSLGGQLGFSLDEIDELGIAVVQACGSSMETAEEMWGEGATLQLRYSSTDRGIAVDVEALAPAGAAARARGARTAPARERLPAPRPAPGLAAQRPRREVEQVQRALTREMIRLFVDDFRQEVNTGRRQIRYRMVKYLIS